MERKKILVLLVCVPLLAFSAWRIVPFLFQQGITDRWESSSATPRKAPGSAVETALEDASSKR
jgi:hypothetical protein